MPCLQSERLVILNVDEDVEQLELSHTLFVYTFIHIFKANSHALGETYLYNSKNWILFP